MLLLTGVLAVPTTVVPNAVDDDDDDPSTAPDLICIDRRWLSFDAIRALLLFRCDSSAAAAAAAAAAASEAVLDGNKEDEVFIGRVGVEPGNTEYVFIVELASPISCLVDDKALTEVCGTCAEALRAPGGAVVVADHVVLVRGGAAADEEAVDVKALDAGRFLRFEVRYEDDGFRASSGVCNGGFRSRSGLAMAVDSSAIAGAPLESDSAAAAVGGDAPSLPVPVPVPPLLPCRRLAAASRSAMAEADVSRDGGCWLLIVRGIYSLLAEQKPNNVKRSLSPWTDDRR
jgi:hypothetical protein